MIDGIQKDFMPNLVDDRAATFQKRQHIKFLYCITDTVQKFSQSSKRILDFLASNWCLDHWPYLKSVWLFSVAKATLHLQMSVIITIFTLYPSTFILQLLSLFFTQKVLYCENCIWIVFLMQSSFYGGYKERRETAVHFSAEISLFTCPIQ